MREWKHDDLAENLALAIGPTPFLNVPLGDTWFNHSQRADVIVIKPSYTEFCSSIYEIKISRSDFLSDIRSGKWRGYLPHCHRFYFAVTAGVASVKDIPEEAGLIVRGQNGWRVVKKAPRKEVNIPHETLLSMLFSKQRLPLRCRNVNRVLTAFEDRFHSHKVGRAKVVGTKLAEAYAKREKYDSEIDTLQWKNETMESYLDEMRRVIQNGLGLPESRYLSFIAISKRLEELKAEVLEAIEQEV